MTNFQIQYWHDIPVLVRAKDGKDRHSAQLPARFMEAVDSAAMAAGMVGSDEYLRAFHWSEPENRAGSPEHVATEVARELDELWPVLDWKSTAAVARSAAAGR